MRKTFIVLLFFCILPNMYAEDWDVLSSREFRSLSIEDKIDYLFYNYPIEESIFLSIEQDFQWYADTLANSEGGNCIPYLKEIVERSSYIEMESDPYAMNLIIFSHCIHYLRNEEDFSDQDRHWFYQEITEKLIEYLEAFHTIDAITFYARLTLEDISNERIEMNGYKTLGAFLAHEFESYGFYDLAILENAGGILMYPYGILSSPVE